MANDECPMGGKHDWQVVRGYGIYPDVKVCTKCGKRMPIGRQKRNTDVGQSGIEPRSISGRAWSKKKK